MPAKKKTNPGALNFNDFGYNEFNMAVPTSVQSISTDETAENSEPENEKKTNQHKYKRFLHN